MPKLIVFPSKILKCVFFIFLLCIVILYIFRRGWFCFTLIFMDEYLETASVNIWLFTREYQPRFFGGQYFLALGFTV